MKIRIIDQPKVISIGIRSKIDYLFLGPREFRGFDLRVSFIISLQIQIYSERNKDVALPLYNHFFLVDKSIMFEIAPILDFAFFRAQ